MEEDQNPDCAHAIVNAARRNMTSAPFISLSPDGEKLFLADTATRLNSYKLLIQKAEGASYSLILNLKTLRQTHLLLI